MTLDATSQRRFTRLQWRALIVGVVGGLLSILGAYLDPVQFFRSYLVAFLFWWSIPLGCLAILMIHHLVGGTWGAVIRRTLEAATRTLPLLLALFVPLLFGMAYLYSWVDPAVVAGDAALQHKSAFLNTRFFVLRAAGYFVSWLGLAYFLNRGSRRQEGVGDWATDQTVRRRLRLISAPGLALYGLTVTFAAVDWMMSLEPLWYSTIYGMRVAVGQLLAGLALAVIVMRWLGEEESLADVLTPDHFQDLGNFLLTFVMAWIYVAFSQYLIIWSGNLPEEIPWYLRRGSGGWGWVAMLLLLFHFLVPFVLLLARPLKRRGSLLAALAAGLLCMHLIELFWLVMPAFYPSGLSVHWLDFVVPVGIGGLWLALFLWQLRKRSLLPFTHVLQGAPTHGS
jgi:hypothetical protein